MSAHDPNNIFSIARRGSQGRAEDQLTEMLAWLSRAVPSVAQAVVKLAYPTMPFKGREAPEVETQYAIPGGSLDAIFHTGSSVIVVESKLGSTFGKGQLSKYVRWLAHQPEPHRALVALTETHAPWPKEVLVDAQRHSVTVAPSRWRDLYASLATASATDARSETPSGSAALIDQFCEMLAEEGLVPEEPMGAQELHSWDALAARTARPYHTFFRETLDRLEPMISAVRHRNAESYSLELRRYYWLLTYAGTPWVVLELSAPRDRTLREVGTRVCIAVNPSVAGTARLVAEGWHAETRRERKPDAARGWMQLWRDLDLIVGDGSFAEQTVQLANACSQVILRLATPTL